MVGSLRNMVGNTSGGGQDACAHAHDILFSNQWLRVYKIWNVCILQQSTITICMMYAIQYIQFDIVFVPDSLQHYINLNALRKYKNIILV